MTTIAFLGVGKMGSRMAQRLIEADHQVRVFDPSKQATDALAAAGAHVAASPAAAADGADWIFTSLPTPAILRAALVGDDGALSTAKSGAGIIDFSTVDPTTAKQMAKLCGERGVSFLDSPVSGGVAGAASGNLVLMVGGASDVIDRARPVLETLASKIVHCGDVGAGQLTKLSHNLLTAINTVALAEVLTAGVKSGAKLDVLCDVLSAGMAGSKMLDYLPKTLFTAERPANFAIDLMHKDISLCLEEFSAFPLPVSQIVRQMYNVARSSGLGGKDSTSVAEVYEGLLGVQLNAKS